MFLTYLILALTVSIDSLGIGITYGIKNTKILIFPKIVLFLLSMFISYLSINLGDFINLIIPHNISTYIGSFILIGMGLWIIYQSINKREKTDINPYIKKEYNFFIKSLGITIQIIRNPISSDLDNSKSIEWKEAIYLALALSLDSIGIGIAVSVIRFFFYTISYISSYFPSYFLIIWNIIR